MAPLSLAKLHLGFSKCQRHCCQFDPLPNVCFLLITKCLIVVLLVASEPTSPSAPRQKAYVFTFLLSARLFIPPPELLARVCELCIKQQQLDQSPLDTVGTAQHANTHEANKLLAPLRICMTVCFPSTTGAGAQVWPQNPAAADGVDGDVPYRLQGGEDGRPPEGHHPQDSAVRRGKLRTGGY